MKLLMPLAGVASRSRVQPPEHQNPVGVIFWSVEKLEIQCLQ
jgi:hypothetical protein